MTELLIKDEDLTSLKGKTIIVTGMQASSVYMVFLMQKKKKGAKPFQPFKVSQLLPAFTQIHIQAV